ncbi:MAG: cation diffusion facilitator family transporter [Gammaproteobacteria bacterium]|nr:cation diffusion facilitator family transporter [Gammaproteobacteria bacterium]
MAHSSTKVILAALFGNLFIAITKFIAAWYTRSSAMLSEGIHSTVDTGNQVLLLWGMRQSKKPANPRFPFGHGKEIYFWSFVVAILLFALGAGVSFYEGIIHIYNPEPMENVFVNYIVLFLAIIFEGGSCYVAFTEFMKVKGEHGIFQAIKRGKDPTMFVVLFEDIAALLGLVIALIGITFAVVTEDPTYDGIASVIIGILLGITAILLAFETKGLLIGESANPEIVDGINKILDEMDVVNHVNEVLTMHVGPEYILANISIDFADNLSSDQIETVVSNLDHQIKTTFPLVKRIFIEAEAWKSSFSKIPDSLA